MINIKKITTDDFDVEVIDSPIPVVVHFCRSHCGPYRLMIPVLENLAEEFNDGIKFVQVDVDAESELAFRFSIQETSELIVFFHGLVYRSFLGLVIPDTLKAVLEEVLPANSEQLFHIN